MKGRSCTICDLPAAARIDELLRSGRSARSVALEFGLSDDAVGRHARRLPGRRPRPADRGAEAAAMLAALAGYLTAAADPTAGRRADAAWLRYRATLADFGLNPSARTRVAATPEEPA